MSIENQDKNIGAAVADRTTDLVVEARELLAHYREGDVLTLSCVPRLLASLADEVERLRNVLRPFAEMDREGSCDLSEIACVRGVGIGLTAISSGDFRNAALALVNKPDTNQS